MGWVYRLWDDVTATVVKDKGCSGGVWVVVEGQEECLEGQNEGRISSSGRWGHAHACTGCGSNGGGLQWGNDAG